MLGIEVSRSRCCPERELACRVLLADLRKRSAVKLKLKFKRVHLKNARLLPQQCFKSHRHGREPWPTRPRPSSNEDLAAHELMLAQGQHHVLRATAHIVEQTPSGPGLKLTSCKVNKLIRLNHEAVHADEDHGVVLVVVPVDASGERMNGQGTKNILAIRRRRRPQTKLLPSTEELGSHGRGEALQRGGELE